MGEGGGVKGPSYDVGSTQNERGGIYNRQTPLSRCEQPENGRGRGREGSTSYTQKNKTPKLESHGPTSRQRGGRKEGGVSKMALKRATGGTDLEAKKCGKERVAFSL